MHPLGPGSALRPPGMTGVGVRRPLSPRSAIFTAEIAEVAEGLCGPRRCGLLRTLVILVSLMVQ